jgi:hypothetical protein
VGLRGVDGSPVFGAAHGVRSRGVAGRRRCARGGAGS